MSDKKDLTVPVKVEIDEDKLNRLEAVVNGLKEYTAQVAEIATTGETLAPVERVAGEGSDLAERVETLEAQLSEVQGQLQQTSQAIEALVEMDETILSIVSPDEDSEIEED